MAATMIAKSEDARNGAENHVNHAVPTPTMANAENGMFSGILPTANAAEVNFKVPTTMVASDEGEVFTNVQAENQTNGAVKPVGSSTPATSDEAENPTNRYPSSGISVIITGAGVAGMYFAMECVRNGHRPIIIEARNKRVEPDGDFFVIGHSATRNMKYWPDFKTSYDKYYHDTWVNYNKHDGTFIDGPMPAQPHLGRIFIRKHMHEMITAEVQRQRVPIIYDDKVVDYFETPTSAGVVLASGMRMEADMVAAGDGVHSRSWRIVNGTKDEPIYSGFSILRASMPVEQAKANPLVKAKFNNVDGHPETLEFLFGPDTHTVVVFGKGTACWLCMHKDNPEATSRESWNNVISSDEALKMMDRVPGWSEDLRALVRASNNIVDWRLMMRNPQDNWVSPKGRIVQIGDAAHAFLPTSANGATQALEDGVSLATCLRLAGGKEGITTATRVHNALRKDRVSCAQLSGLLKREEAHKVNWELVMKNPEILRSIVPGKWLAKHDPEEYAIENFEACKETLKHGEQFKNTNTPEGYTLKPWDVFRIIKDADEGKMLTLEGDW